MSMPAARTCFSARSSLISEIRRVPAEVLELAVELLEQQAPGRYLVQAYKRLAALLKEQGDIEEAFAVLERALGVQDRVGRPLT